MKKAASLVDKALEVSRRERDVPKKPVKTKGKKTVPAALDWGPGIPLDKLAYLNDDEMALIQAKRMFKGKRKYKGVPAFPDPGDTAAGDTGQGTSSSSGLGGNTTSGGSTYGGGGGSDSGAGGAGGMGSYGGEGGREGGGGSGSGGAGTTSTGSSYGGPGGDRSSPDSSGRTSAGASSSSTSASGSGASSDTTKTSAGPGGGSLSAPARTEASSYGSAARPASPASPTGSYQSYGGYDPTRSAPSTMASEAALDRIASGSSVIGNTAPGGYPTPKIQDRVPTSITYASPTTVAPVDTTGANSPFADPNVTQYDADRPSLAGAVSQYSQYRSPPSPTTSAYTNAQNQMYVAEDAANFGENGALPRGGGYIRTQDPTPTSYSPTPTQYAQSDMSGTVGAYGNLAGPNQGLGYNPTAPGAYAGNAAVASAQTPAVQATTGLGAAKPITDRVPVADATKPYGDRLMTVNGTTYSISPQQMANLTPAEQQAISAYNQAIEYNPAGVSQQLQSSYDPLSSVTPPAQTGALVSSGPPSATRGLPAPVAGANLTNPFYSSPAQQAADIRRAVTLAQGPATTPTSVTPASSEVVQPVETAGEYDYDPAKDPTNYMRPIYPGEENQPTYFTPEQRQKYSDSLGGTRSSEFMTPIGNERDVIATTNVDRGPNTEKDDTVKYVPQEQVPYVYRDYMYTDYPETLPAADPNIVAFNRYNKRRLNKGGRIGDSVDAALRIARSKLL